MNVLERLSQSNLVKIPLTLIVYSLYASVLGACLLPSVLLVLQGFLSLVLPSLLAGILPTFGEAVLFALMLGGSFFLFYFFGLLIIGSVMRLFSLPITPGSHPAASLATLCWMIHSGVYTLAWRLILPLVPMTFFTQMFYRIAGCKIGKNVWINTNNVLDPYMISIGDNTVVGGEAILSPHVFENGRVTILPIRIGRNCLIGGHAYISPGVTIGDGSLIGLRAYIRKGVTVPPGSRILSVAGMSARRTYEVERGASRLARGAVKE